MVMDRLSGTFAALADPTRRAILARRWLGEQKATLHELAGRYRARGQVRGRRVEFACTGCCEWAGS